MPTRILFVDDDPFLLQAQRRLLFRVKEWKCTFCENGETAIQEAKSAIDAGDPFDVLVSDMRMPKMNGAELCRAMRQLNPACIRIMLSGQTESGTLCRVFGPSHQYLHKPCAPEDLQQSVTRSLSLLDYIDRDHATATVRSLNIEEIQESRRSVIRASRGPTVTSVSLAEQMVPDYNWSRTLETIVSLHLGLGSVESPAESGKQLFNQIELADLRTFAAAAIVFTHLMEEFSPFKDIFEETIQAGVTAAIESQNTMTETAGWEVVQWAQSRNAEETMLGALLHRVSSLLPFKHISRPECLSAALLAQLGLPHSVVAFVAARRTSMHC